jgi:hypothetical protein
MKLTKSVCLITVMLGFSQIALTGCTRDPFKDVGLEMNAFFGSGGWGLYRYGNVEVSPVGSVKILLREENDIDQTLTLRFFFDDLQVERIQNSTYSLEFQCINSRSCIYFKDSKGGSEDRTAFHIYFQKENLDSSYDWSNKIKNKMEKIRSQLK